MDKDDRKLDDKEEVSEMEGAERFFFGNFLELPAFLRFASLSDFLLERLPLSVREAFRREEPPSDA